jgi:diguanylate cyclase (GGDEF)-like protein
MQLFSNIWTKFIKFITFVNLPIKKKFLLFGLGTFFWFAVIGTVSVSVLTFIHYRYSQISNTTIPYMQAIQIISPKLDAIEQLSIWSKNDENQEKHLFEATLQLRQIQNAISATAINVNNSSSSNNFFETLTYTLSKDDPEGLKTLQALVIKIKEMDNLISLGCKRAAGSQDYKLANIWGDLDQHIIESKDILKKFSDRTNEQLATYSKQMNETIKYSINTIAIVLLIAVSLLWFFTRWLTEAFSRPIESMINQIHSIGTGEVDLNKKLKIKSEDEIGALSKEFNKLVDTVYGVTVFKKVIEEDTTLDAVYGRLADVFAKESGIEEFRIFDVNNAKEQMVIVQPPLAGEESMFCHAEILHDCSLCRAQKTGHKISSLEYESVCRQFIGGDKEHVCIPLMVTGQPGAIAQFIFDKDGCDKNIDSINEKVFKAESYIKNSLSVIETKQLMHTLRESSLVDGLTGLYNRRFLQDHSNQIIAGVLRRKKQISLLMCDMDFFKQVNDEHGHDVGDSVLKDTSRVLRESVRESDVVIRFGGEEFLILLIDTEPGYGYEVAEKIRENIEKVKFQGSKGSVIKKTISMGISEFPKDTKGFWQAIKFADVALYSAKDTGRNKCVRFAPDMWEEGSF